MKGDSLRTLNVAKGRPISASRENDVLRRVANLPGETPSLRRAIGTGLTGIRRPFDLLLTTYALTTNYDLAVWPGTVNSSVPSNIFTTFNYVSGSTRYVKLDVTTNGKAVTSSVMTVDATPPVPITTIQGTAPTAFSVLIGIIASNTVYKTWSGGNCQATMAVALTEEKASPTPGLSPFNYWYTWTPSAV